MALTDHQKTIMNYAREHNDTITKQEACKLIPYYYNTSKHVGDVLSRMVKANLLKRIKNGVFVISSGVKQDIKIENQLELL